MPNILTIKVTLCWNTWTCMCRSLKIFISKGYGHTVSTRWDILIKSFKYSKVGLAWYKYRHIERQPWLLQSVWNLSIEPGLCTPFRLLWWFLVLGWWRLPYQGKPQQRTTLLLSTKHQELCHSIKVLGTIKSILQNSEYRFGNRCF